jgi:hypothetical protein
MFIVLKIRMWLDLFLEGRRNSLSGHNLQQSKLLFLERVDKLSKTCLYISRAKSRSGVSIFFVVHL